MTWICKFIADAPMATWLSQAYLILIGVTKMSSDTDNINTGRRWPFLKDLVLSSELLTDLQLMEGVIDCLGKRKRKSHNVVAMYSFMSM